MKHFPQFLEKYFQNITDISSYQNFYRAINTSNNIHISGFNLSSFAIFLYDLYYRKDYDLLVLCSEDKIAEKLRDDLDYFFNQDKTGYLPKIDSNNKGRDVSENESFFYNDVKNKLLDSSNYLYISEISGLNINFPSRKSHNQNRLYIENHAEINRDDFINELYSFGYNRVEQTTFPEDFSVRASIVDIFIPGYSFPYRIEFFGDTIDSLRKFDPEDQKTKDIVNSVEIFPLPNSEINTENKATITDHLETDKSLVIYFDFDNIDEHFNDSLKDFKKIYRHNIYSQKIDFPFFEVDIQDKNLKGLRTYIEHQSKDSSSFVIFSSRDKQVERLRHIFHESKIKIQKGYFSSSFYFKEKDIYFISENDVLSHAYRTRLKNKRLPSDIDVKEVDIGDITPGDYMVHVDYGIGQFEGLDKVDAFGTTTECLKLEYRGDSIVYVPMEKLHDVKKYRNTGENPPRVTKLHSGEWERKKSKTKKSAEKIVDELITLYSIRKNAEGYKFSNDDELQIEMESEFPHQETPDQIQATEEIKDDMESDQPMDRLLCGDVGFGKTEVAIRAAFKAVLNKKQVAILVPTTILTDQHYSSFKERLQNYPIIIEKLSRFVTKSKQKQIIDDIEEGNLDIVIGTHRLLSGDIEFNDLGLLIIDEEHRFGVKNKEKIKNVKKNLDVLSLTATPIPRTLQFSLIGARDFSQINTPPKFRLPIVTEIINFDRDFIRERINFELNRNGQVYFVHNRIKTIKAVTTKVHSIVPEASIDYAHGRMKEKRLEKTINSFINNELDILVTTSIIESGIDIPNVNTMFINKAHNFGLAQLYQLRGRVGRSNRRAFCYLIAPKMKKLNDSAIKRLNTIKRYTSLGSGYNIALSDMEIRGAGNLFGVEQSGNIQKIGYDLYVKILQDTFEDKKEAISDAINIQDKKEKSKPTESVKIISPYSALIPDHFVESQKMRLDFYKRLSEAESNQEIDGIKNEIKDRFGRLPEETKKLINITKLKIFAYSVNINKIIIKNSGKCELKFNGEEIEDNINIVLKSVKNICNKLDISYKFKPSENLVLILYTNEEETMEHLSSFLLELIDKL
ncbi:MAG: transcription-repair coupling factor [Candidatus Marinimicrobia bacterium]|nr:transcription-repair coupling factor [Candidatus Neomarinimicrobiota bacterium]